MNTNKKIILFMIAGFLAAPFLTEASSNYRAAVFSGTNCNTYNYQGQYTNQADAVSASKVSLESCVSNSSPPPGSPDYSDGFQDYSSVVKLPSMVDPASGTTPKTYSQEFSADPVGFFSKYNYCDPGETYFAADGRKYLCFILGKPNLTDITYGISGVKSWIKSSFNNMLYHQGTQIQINYLATNPANFYIHSVNCPVAYNWSSCTDSLTTVPLTQAIVTPAGVPDAPKLSASFVNDRVQLNWLTPFSSGASAITGYKIYKGTSSGVENLLSSGSCANLGGSVLTCTDTNVVKGTNYYYEVTAINALGESLISNEVNPSAIGIDLKINNSDGPLNLPINSTLNISWTTAGGGALTCAASGSTDWAGAKSSFGGSGSVSLGNSPKTYILQCSYNDNGVTQTVQDLVVVNPYGVKFSTPVVSDGSPSVSDPAAANRGSITLQGQPVTAFISGGYAYPYDSSGFAVYNISSPYSPSSPKLMGTTAINGIYLYRVFIQGNYAYNITGFNSDIFEIVDISNKSVPREVWVTRAYVGVTTFKSIYVSGNYLYIYGANNKLYIYDVTNPSVPVLVAAFSISGVNTGTTLSVFVSGNNVYVKGPSKYAVISVNLPAISVDMKAKRNSDANFNDGPIFVPPNSNVTLQWDISAGSTCTASGDWSGSYSGNSNKSVNVGVGISNPGMNSPKSYILTCSYSNGDVASSIQDAVQVIPYAVDLKANGSDGPIIIPPNSGVSLSWAIVDGGNMICVPSGGAWVSTGNKTGTASENTLLGTLPTTYTLECSYTLDDGSTTSRQDSIQVIPYSVDLKVNDSDGPVNVPLLGTLVLTWTTVGGNNLTCTASGSGDWTGVKSNSGGSEKLSVGTSPKTYTLQCNYSGGTISDSVQVNLTAAMATTYQRIQYNSALASSNFTCTPYVNDQLNYQGIYSSKEDAIKATIASLETCLSKNSYSKIVPDLSPEYLARGGYGNQPNILPWVGDWGWTGGGTFTGTSPAGQGWKYTFNPLSVWDWSYSNPQGLLTKSIPPPPAIPAPLACVAKFVVTDAAADSHRKLWVSALTPCTKDFSTERINGILKQVDYADPNYYQQFNTTYPSASTNKYINYVIPLPENVHLRTVRCSNVQSLDACTVVDTTIPTYKTINPPPLHTIVYQPVEFKKYDPSYASCFTVSGSPCDNTPKLPFLCTPYLMKYSGSDIEYTTPYQTDSINYMKGVYFAHVNDAIASSTQSLEACLAANNYVKNQNIGYTPLCPSPVNNSSYGIAWFSCDSHGCTAHANSSASFNCASASGTRYNFWYYKDLSQITKSNSILNGTARYIDYVSQSYYYGFQPAYPDSIHMHTTRCGNASDTGNVSDGGIGNCTAYDVSASTYQVVNSAPTAVTGAKISVKTEDGQHFFVLTWNKPTGSFGDLPLSYKIYQDGIGKDFQIGEVPGLEYKAGPVISVGEGPGPDYKYRVVYYIVAHNDMGDSDSVMVSNSAIINKLNPITINGSGFSESAFESASFSLILSANPSVSIPCDSLSYISPTQLSLRGCNITHAPAGSYGLTVTLQGGKVLSLPDAFIVSYPQPKPLNVQLETADLTTGRLNITSVTGTLLSKKDLVVKILAQDTVNSTTNISCSDPDRCQYCALSYDSVNDKFSGSCTISTKLLENAGGAGNLKIAIANGHESLGASLTSSNTSVNGSGFGSFSCIANCNGKPACASDGCGRMCGPLTTSCTMNNYFGSCPGTGYKTCDIETPLKNGVHAYGSCVINPATDPRIATCSGKNCGPDTCGGYCPPNSCVSPQSCGGGGTIGVCGCTPLTKAAACGNKECSSVSDNCGGSISCGSCGGFK